MRDLLKAHEYLRRKGLAFDLVVLNDHASSYLQDLQNTLLQMVEGSPEQSWVDRPGGVFLRRADLMPPEDRTLLEAAARVVMDGADGNLREQLKRPQIPFGPRAWPRFRSSRLPPKTTREPRAPSTAASGRPRDVQRHRRFRRRRPRIRHLRRSGRRHAPTSALVERRRASDVRLCRRRRAAPATRGRETATTTG